MQGFSSAAPAVPSTPAADLPLETFLLQVLARLALPPRLAAAAHYAVFSGGARWRPRLCLAVYASAAPHDQVPGVPVAATQLAVAAAAALELLHCASLVHDDLPCFDNAAWRRGQPSVHCRFGENLAVLVGDGLIVGAFAALTPPPGCDATRHAQLFAKVSDTAARLVGGQGWESETNVDLAQYHGAKTVAFFRAAVACGALASGSVVAPWLPFGEALGRAYQLADDIADCHEDAATQQPNLATARGPHAARQALQHMLAQLPQHLPSHLNAMQRAPLLHWLALFETRLRTSLTAPHAPKPAMPLKADSTADAHADQS